MIVAAGPREAEERVLAWFEARRARGPEELWPPVRIVVPSRSLARHLNAALARRFEALAGVVVQTHRALAREVVERAGETPPPGGALAQEILVRRLAAEEPALAEALGALDDGYAPVAAAVRDLVDAGMRAAMAGELEGALRASGLSGDRLERASAVVRVAGRWLELAEEHGLSGRSGLLVRAAELVSRAGSGILPARGILVHGFAEATGVVSALLEGLVLRHGAEVVLDLPPDPARPGERDAGAAFVERLAARLGGSGRLGDVGWAAPGSGPRELEAFTAPGPDAELREVASRIRSLLDDGKEKVEPETVGVVVRSMDGVTAAAVRRHLGRLGIPFSGEGVTVPEGETARRRSALLELLSKGPAASVASWLAAAGGVPEAGDPRLLELALRSAGVVRLAGAARLGPHRLCRDGWFRVPVVERIEEGGEGPRRINRRVRRDWLQAARDAAAELVARLEKRPRSAPVSGHLEWVRRILGWLGMDRDAAVSAALAELEGAVPGGFQVGWTEVEPVLARALAAPEEELGGAGGGVQVLTVMEARSRTFTHLFLAGLNRGIFPRRAHEDPLLPDPARRALAAVLPEMPLGERAPVEERYLFAQLLAAARKVTLSWQTADAEGRARNPSAFVERLRLEGRLPEEVAAAAEVFGGRPAQEPRPALEHAAAAGLVGRRDGLVEAARVLADGRAAHMGPLLDELDPPRPRSDLGPFLGTTGLGPPAGLWATRLEAYSACPWRQFLERELGLAPPPEAVLAQTGLEGLLGGSVVHRVLEAVVRRAGAPAARDTALAGLEGSQPVRVPWPPQEELEGMIHDAAREVAAGQGVMALAPALVRAARRFLDRARELEWPDGVLQRVLGAEVEGACTLGLTDGREAVIRFRADRVDRGDVGLVLTDYKTGKSGRQIETLLRRGERLQGAVYACGGGEGAVGRYVYLSPESKRSVETVAGEAAGELAGVVEILLAAWEAGLAVPRWETPGGQAAQACRYCDLQEACFRGDSTFRARLERAVEAAGTDPQNPLGPLWRLPAAPARRGGGKGGGS